MRKLLLVFLFLSLATFGFARGGYGGYYPYGGAYVGFGGGWRHFGR